MIESLRFRTSEIAEYISWSYFFYAWGFPPRYSQVAKVHDCQSCITGWINQFETKEEQARAQEAVKLYNDARKIIADVDGKYDFRCRFAILDAVSKDDDICVYGEDGIRVCIPCLRQQYNPEPNGMCLCLADYIRPESMGGRDRIGVFVASNDGEMEQQGGDDGYVHLLYQTLSDRLCEAGTEWAHALIRRKYWGYAPDEKCSVDDMIVGKYRGIRTAIGYPSMPDQSIIFILDKLIDFSQIGVQVTEIGAMKPHSSTCGLMFAHPRAHYFNVGKIGMDQAEDYIKRRGLPKEVMQKYLRQNIVI